jgi:hypothetical protein
MRVQRNAPPGGSFGLGYTNRPLISDSQLGRDVIPAPLAAVGWGKAIFGAVQTAKRPGITPASTQFRPSAGGLAY